MKLKWPQARHLIISPHLDDGVLSCGGLIWEQAARGESIAVVTLCAASPPRSLPLSPIAAELHARWQAALPPGSGFSDLLAVRRAEDIRSLSMLHPAIEAAHMPLLDCIYRHHPATGEPLYPHEADIFGPVHPADPARTLLETLAPPPPDRWVYCPLAIGNHVDHQLARWAVEGWGIPPGQLFYYEDYPYADDPAALSAIIDRQAGWIPRTIALSPAALDAKIAAVAQHVSQIETFWASVEVMSDRLRAFATRVGGERLWVAAGQPADLTD